MLLKDIILDINLSMTFFHNSTPYKHQEEAFELSKSKPSLLLEHDCGLGKTLTVITILRSKYAIHKILLRTLILVPQIVIENFKNEIVRFSKIRPQDIVTLGDSAKRIQEFNCRCFRDSMPQGKIVIINYEALLGDIFEEIIRWNPEIVVCDEIHKIKNHKAKRTKKVLQLGENAVYRYGLTGTLLLNSVADIFSPFHFLDKRIFGTNFYVFQNKYMMDANAAWSNRPGAFKKWVARPEMFQELSAKVAMISHKARKEECLDLPPLIKIRKDFSLTAKQRKLYKEMECDFMATLETKEGNKTVIAQLALTKALRLQQIALGYFRDVEGNDIQIEEKNPRDILLYDLLEEITPQHKVIVWTSFVYTYKIIVDICKSLGIEYSLLTGEQSVGEKETSMRNFKECDSVRVIIANRRAGIGINLVEAKYSIVYSRNFSLEEEIQSEARNYRGGSERHKNIVKIDLVASGTIEEQIIKALANKEEVANVIFNAYKKLEDQENRESGYESV